MSSGVGTPGENEPGTTKRYVMLPACCVVPFAGAGPPVPLEELPNGGSPAAPPPDPGPAPPPPARPPPPAPPAPVVAPAPPLPGPAAVSEPSSEPDPLEEDASSLLQPGPVERRRSERAMR